MAERISDGALDQLFLDARSHNEWIDRDVPDSLLRELMDIVKMGPTSANCCPARFVFVRSDAAKARLLPHVAPSNRDKARTAPVCAILGNDYGFPDHLPKLFPHEDARSWFAGKEKAIAETAERNATLQGGYFIIAARALGLDTGAMSGFDNQGIDREFFPESTVKSNFLCNLGYGDPAGLFPRLPRFDFDEFAKII